MVGWPACPPPSVKNNSRPFRAHRGSVPPSVDTVAEAARPSLDKARAFALRGEYGAAKLHAELALVHDPTNDALTSLDRWLAEKVLRARE